MEAALLDIVSTINSYLSNYVLLVLLIGTGLYFTVRTRFVQFRCFGEGWKKMFGGFSLRGGDHGGAMSSFQALATAIAAQVGTGNIVGACGAILIGGPGAIFWMWIIALLGMATNYAEATLAQKTKVIGEDGGVHGGPAYYITTAFKGAGGRFLAGFFSVAIILALGFIGCMVQSNSIAETMNNATGIPSWIVGLVVAIVAEFATAEGDAIAEGYALDASGSLVDADGEIVLSDDDTGDPAALAKAIGISKTNMAQLAFGAFFTAGPGNIFVAICLLFFAFSTILSWNLFGKLNVQWLFRKQNTKVPVIIYSIIGIAFVFMGSLLQNDLVWELQDMFNQLMVLPNAIALIALSGWVVKCANARGTKTGEIMADEL